MITRILIGLLAAAAIAIVVLALLLRSASADARDCKTAAKVRQAVAEQAIADAYRAIAEADTLRRQHEATQREIKLLHDQLDAIQRKRPNFNARPRPTDAAGHRASILRAVRQ